MAAPASSWADVIRLLEKILERLDAVENRQLDTLTMEDENGVERITLGRDDDGAWGLRIYTADPTDPDHRKHNLTA